MPRPTALLYDWDNTLVDAWGGIAHAQNAVFRAFAMPEWSVAETRERVRGSLRDVYPGMFGSEWGRARDIFYAALKQGHLDHVRPMPGAASLLEAGRGAPQAVVSNKAGPFLRAEVKHLGWADHFRSVLGAGDAARDKPDPAPLLEALSVCGRKPGKPVWYIGDTALDMQAARNAGVTAVLVGDAAHDGGIGRAAPDLHFPDCAALASHLRSLGG
jgi:phosphoglycolate phosphatase